MFICVHLSVSSGMTLLLYKRACMPAPPHRFVQHLGAPEVNLSHYGVGGSAVKPLVEAMRMNPPLKSLILTGNWLGEDGGVEVSRWGWHSIFTAVCRCECDCARMPDVAVAETCISVAVRVLDCALCVWAFRRVCL